MIFFYKFISIKVTKQIVDPIIVFAANFKVLTMKVNRIEKYEVTDVVINMQNTTILNFEQIISTSILVQWMLKIIMKESIDPQCSTVRCSSSVQRKDICCRFFFSWTHLRPPPLFFKGKEKLFDREKCYPDSIKKNN